MFIALLQLERIIIKNGYAIVPKEWLIDFLKNYKGQQFRFGILHFNKEKNVVRHFTSDEFEVKAWGDPIYLNGEPVLRKDIGKWINTFSEYQICSVKQTII